MLIAKRGRSLLYYDGRNFSSSGRRKIFGTMAGAYGKGERLLARHPVLRSYTLYAKPV